MDATKIMYLLSLTLSIVCFITMVSGDIARKKHPNFECALRRCSVEDVKCDSSLTSSRCCSVCPKVSGCFYKGKYYKDGERFKDVCNWCGCRKGRVGCTKIGCLPKKCKYNGIFYNEGQLIPSKNPCSECYCRKGRRQCSIMACKHVFCEGQRTLPGKCCPVCQDITM